jgi:hypothetical protein
MEVVKNMGLPTPETGMLVSRPALEIACRQMILWVLSLQLQLSCHRFCSAFPFH